MCALLVLGMGWAGAGAVQQGAKSAVQCREVGRGVSMWEGGAGGQCRGGGQEGGACVGGGGQGQGQQEGGWYVAYRQEGQGQQERGGEGGGTWPAARRGRGSRRVVARGVVHGL